MPKITVIDEQLVLEYEGPQNGVFWVHEKLREGEEARIQRVFCFTDEDAITPLTAGEIEADDFEEDFDAFEFLFVLGEDGGEYFWVAGRKLGIDQDVYISKDFDAKLRHFVVPRNTSVFRQLAELVTEDIFIGGPEPGAVPVAAFEALVDGMPTDTEIKKYVLARVASVLGNYIDSSADAEASYETYRNRRDALEPTFLSAPLRVHEIAKYETIRERLHTMLERQDTYSERVWQEEITDILTLVYPKYIAALREAPVLRDGSSQLSVDFVLVDADGHVDLLEIKKPADKQVMKSAKYRGNHIPIRDLTGSVMQLEKYIYHLVRSGKSGERALTKKFAGQLPGDLAFKVTNPHGLVLLGRDTALTEKQKRDFEIVRRQYKNLIDILTYDDLLRRLDFTLSRLESNLGASEDSQ